MPDYKKAFENSLLKLCQSIRNEELKKLDNLLCQEKLEVELMQDLVAIFPQFTNFYQNELKKYNYE